MSVVDRPPFVAGSLTDIAGAAALFDRFPAYRQTLVWVREFVLQPDPRLGRPGAVCPRLAAGIDRSLVRLVALCTDGTGAQDAIEAASALADLFDEVFTAAEDRRRGAVMACFPDLNAAAAGGFIDGGHALVRRDFVRRGLMLGEFHAASTVGSARNREFPVMRCPVPMFAVRQLTVHDHLFLDHPGPHRRELVTFYLAHVGDRVPADVRARLEASLVTIGE